MRRVLLAGLFVLALSPAHANSGGGDGPKPLSAKPFFDSIRGSYRIELVGGHVPAGNDPKGTVELESEEAVLTFPYCLPSGACDPGYIFLPYGVAQVNQKGSVTHIAINDGTTTFKYAWEEAGGKIFFTNYQYRLDEKTVVTLVHVMKRVTE